MKITPRPMLIRRVAKSGLSFEDLACISGLPTINLYKAAAGKYDLTKNETELLGAILDCKPEDLTN